MFLSSEMQRHPHATPERLAWIERDAPSKRSPGAWATECVRQGWPVPATTSPDSARVARSRSIKEGIASLDTLTSDTRAALIRHARLLWPNLADPQNHPDDSPVMRGAAARVMLGLTR